jgi:predicted nucleic acid-binding protein
MRGSPESEKFKPYLVDKIPTVAFITVAELHYGAYNAGWGERRLAQLEQTIRRYAVLPYDDNLAKLWGKLRAKARATGSPLGQADHANDLWIAACSIYYQAPLLTGNRRHMCDLEDLSLADDEPS